MSATVLSSASHADARSLASSSPSRGSVIAGRIMTGVVVLFLVFDSSIKVARTKWAVEASVPMGFTADQVFIIGVIAAVCLVLYLIPRTAPLGALLWTGYLGGAIVTHFRLGNPLLTHTLFPVYVAALLWGGLYLRDPRVRAAVRILR